MKALRLVLVTKNWSLVPFALLTCFARSLCSTYHLSKQHKIFSSARDEMCEAATNAATQRAIAQIVFFNHSNLQSAQSFARVN